MLDALLPGSDRPGARPVGAAPQPRPSPSWRRGVGPNGPARAGRPTRRGARRRAPDPEAVRLRQAARILAARHLSGGCNSRARSRPDYARAGRRDPRAARRHLVTPDGDPSHRGARATGADVEVWIFGSSGGQSAEVAGERGLPFAANYHVSPATVLEAVGGLPGGVPSFGPPGGAVRRGVGRRRRGRRRRRRARSRVALRAVGAQHPHRRGRDPVPDARGGGATRLVRRGPRAGRRPRRHPVRRLAGAPWPTSSRRSPR